LRPDPFIYLKKKERSKMKTWWVVPVIVATFFMATTPSLAAVPNKINYQGYLTNPSGLPLTGSYPMAFALCTAASGGSCPWSETQTVAVDKGVFNVALGVVTPLTLAFDAPYFLDIQVNGESMSARQPLTSVGYAFTADTATNFSGSLTGDVTGSQGATVVSVVGGPTGVSSAQIVVGVNAASNATSNNTPSAIVSRDASGNFSAGTITANFSGNVTGAASLNLLKSGDTMTGNLNMGANNISNVGTITANLTGNATTATALAANGSNCPAGQYPLGVDASGNVEGCSVAGGSADTIAPVPGNSGTITAASGTDIALSWTATTDNLTPQSNLEYTVFYSTSNNINTVANAEANGTVFGFPWSTNITSKTVTGLTVGTTYYFNVAVKDAGLNKVMYTTVSKVPSVSTTNIILYGSGTASGGNLGGRSGANALCSANKPAGYTNYAAFLSVSGSDSIAGRQAFSGLDTARNVRSTNGTLIANNWSDLLDGAISTSLLAAGISVPSHYWWSGSNADGTVGLTCSGWTSSENPASGSDPSGDWGTDGNTTSLWIYPGAVDRTYCAEPTDVLCIAW
jgi:hypothetical protein